MPRPRLRVGARAIYIPRSSRELRSKTKANILPGRGRLGDSRAGSLARSRVFQADEADEWPKRRRTASRKGERTQRAPRFLPFFPFASTRRLLLLSLPFFPPLSPLKRETGYF